MHRNLWIATAAAAATLSFTAPVCAGENPKDVAFQAIDRNTDAMAKIGDSIYYFGANAIFLLRNQWLSRSPGSR
jgi:hypothetical protein